MLNSIKTKTFKTLIIALILSSTSGFAQTESLWDKASGWVKELNLSDETKETTVTSLITSHLTAVRNWHNSHSFEEVPAGINPRTGEKLSDLDRSIIADSAMPDSVHEDLMTGLNTNLTENQVEFILDKYTIGKVDFTMKAYREIVPYLKSYEEAELIKNLKEAREMAIDFKSMKQISAIFEIYKTKNEQYLNSNGRNWHKMYKTYVNKMKAQKARNQ